MNSKVFPTLSFIFSAVFTSCAPTTGNKNPTTEEKGFTLNLSDFAIWSGENSTYNKTTHKFSGNSDGSAGLWLGNYDKSTWTEYNCIRITYSTEDYGFFFAVDYKDSGNTIEEQFYCPSNMTEFVVPLNKALLSKIEQIKIYGCWNHKVNITLKSVTLLNRKDPGPSKTYTEPPVEKITDAGSKKINASISSWKFLPQIGTGFQYGIVSGDNRSIDFGYDISYGGLGYPIESEETIKQIHAKGFRTLRLQVTSGTHIIDDKYTIDPAFIKQVKKIVDWAIADDMYVIICEGLAYLYDNQTAAQEHYSGYCVNRKYEDESKAFLKAVWEQLCLAFNNSYDEHLIFEFMNEPLDTTDHMYQPQTVCATCMEDFKLLNELNQLVLDTIRASGGNNAERYLMVPTLAQSPFATRENIFKLPDDSKYNEGKPNKLIVSVHCYPMESSPEFIKQYYTASIKDKFLTFFKEMDETLFAKKIPVYFSETGGSRKTSIVERINCMTDFIAETQKDNRSCGICHHENADTAVKSDGFGYFSKEAPYFWYDDEYLDVITSLGTVQPSKDFMKNNELQFEWIVNKELLEKPFVFDDPNWGKQFNIPAEKFLTGRTVPETYIIQVEVDIDKTAGYHALQVKWQDQIDWQMYSLTDESNITGATYDASNKNNNFDHNSNTGTLQINIDTTRAKYIEGSGIHLQGYGLTVKSIKVYEQG